MLDAIHSLSSDVTSQWPDNIVFRIVSASEENVNTNNQQYTPLSTNSPLFKYIYTEWSLRNLEQRLWFDRFFYSLGEAKALYLAKRFLFNKNIFR